MNTQTNDNVEELNRELEKLKVGRAEVTYFNMRLVMRKLVFRVSDEVRYKPGYRRWLGLEILELEKRQQKTKRLIRLCGIAADLHLWSLHSKKDFLGLSFPI